MVLAMLSCRSLVWIHTGSGVAAASLSLQFGGFSPLIFLFLVSLLEEWIKLFINKKHFNIEAITENLRALKTRSYNGFFISDNFWKI